MFNIDATQIVYTILFAVMLMNYPRIRDLREEAELTQEAVGRAINVPQRTYAYYESGKRMIPPQVLRELALFYHTSADYIVGLTDERKPYPSGK